MLDVIASERRVVLYLISVSLRYDKSVIFCSGWHLKSLPDDNCNKIMVMVSKRLTVILPLINLLLNLLNHLKPSDWSLILPSNVLSLSWNFNLTIHYCLLTGFKIEFPIKRSNCCIMQYVICKLARRNLIKIQWVLENESFFLILIITFIFSM